MKNQATEKFPARPKIIFMGTPVFAVPCLSALIEHGHNVLAVVTQPDRPKGRGRKVVSPAVKQTAVEYGIEVLQPEKASEQKFCETIRIKAPDLLVVVAFGQILKKYLLDIPRWGGLNIHASLLPKYRGAAPINWAIINNETKTGLSAMRIDEGLDTGPVLMQEELTILPDETAGQLHDRLARLSGDFLIRTLTGWAKNRFRETPQDNADSSYASKIDREISLIKWDEHANAISALIRGLDPWPGAVTMVQGRVIKLFSSGVVNEERKGLTPGMVAGHSADGLEVGTGNGTVFIRELQIPGKRRLPVSDFLRGFPLNRGTLLGT